MARQRTNPLTIPTIGCFVSVVGPGFDRRLTVERYQTVPVARRDLTRWETNRMNVWCFQSLTFFVVTFILLIVITSLTTLVSPATTSTSSTTATYRHSHCSITKRPKEVKLPRPRPRPSAPSEESVNECHRKPIDHTSLAAQACGCLLRIESGLLTQLAGSHLCLNGGYSQTSVHSSPCPVLAHTGFHLVGVLVGCLRLLMHCRGFAVSLGCGQTLLVASISGIVRIELIRVVIQVGLGVRHCKPNRSRSEDGRATGVYRSG